MVLVIYTINKAKFKDIVSNNLFHEFNHNSLYILDNIRWTEIVKLLISSDAHITVSGGSGVKRHLISNVQNRLLSYLLAFVYLYFTKLGIFNSFDYV